MFLFLVVMQFMVNIDQVRVSNLVSLFAVPFLLLVGQSILWPYILAYTRGAALAPRWFSVYPESNLVTRFTKDDSGLYMFQILSLKADCPVCSSAITIINGGPQYSGKLVGVCGQLQEPHQFSVNLEDLSGKQILDQDKKYAT